MVIDLRPREEPDPIGLHDLNCVLIVDRCLNSIEVMTQWFQHQQFKVLSHTCGSYGFQAAIRSTPDCILINLELLDMDGIDLCQRLVDDSATCGVPVILFGNASDGVIVQQAKAAGCEFFVSTPLDPRALILLVNEAIAQSRSWICDSR
jgi:CheY-like chemotaxis protein